MLVSGNEWWRELMEVILLVGWWREVDGAGGMVERG